MHGSNFACLPRSSLLIMASMPTRAKIQIQNRGSKSNIGPDDGGVSPTWSSARSRPTEN